MDHTIASKKILHNSNYRIVSALGQGDSDQDLISYFKIVNQHGELEDFNTDLLILDSLKKLHAFDLNSLEFFSKDRKIKVLHSLVAISLKSKDFPALETKSFLIAATKLVKSDQNRLDYFGCVYDSASQMTEGKISGCEGIDFSGSLEQLMMVDWVEIEFLSLEVKENIELRVRIIGFRAKKSAQDV